MAKSTKPNTTTIPDSPEFTAQWFVARLETVRSPEKAEAHRHLAANEEDVIMGVGMGQVFALAKEFIEMPLGEIEKLLESPLHEARVGAVSIMDWQARSKKTSQARRKELFDLYLRRHDRINYWDLVDRSALYVVGSYLFDKPRDILYTLARSKDVWERRTAMVSTLYFIGKGDVDDAFKIGEILLKDDQDFVHRAFPDRGSRHTCRRRCPDANSTFPTSARKNGAHPGLRIDSPQVIAKWTDSFGPSTHARDRWGGKSGGDAASGAIISRCLA